MKQLNWYQIFGESHKIPDGRTVTPTDDIQIWLHCADIWDKAYTTLNDVIADIDTLVALMICDNAVDYLVRSTTWVGEALVPTMTSNTTPIGYVASAKGALTNREAYRAFDGSAASSADSWAYSNLNELAWLQMQFNQPTTIYSARFVEHYPEASSTSGIKNYTIQGSNDGVTFTDISSGSVPSGQSKLWQENIIANPGAYTVYRFNPTEMHNAEYRQVMTEMQFYSVGLTTSATAMQAIGASDYASTTLLSDATWNSAIQNSEYSEYVDNLKVPTMTSNTTPSGVVLAGQTMRTTNPAYYLFDGDISTGASCQSDTTSAWIGFDFGSKKHIYAMSIYSGSSNRTYTMGYSDDGVTWTDYSDSITPAQSVWTNQSVIVANDHRYWRSKRTVASAISGFGASEAQFYGRENGGVQNWLRAAGISKNYITLSEVLADSTTLNALMASNDAVDYLVTAKGLISGICADSGAMTAIGNNNYCADTLLADSEWLTAICNSTYIESVLNDKNPNMTSASAPSGSVTASSAFGSNYAYYAMDSNSSSQWVTLTASNTTQNIVYDFGRSFRPKFYKFIASHSYKAITPTSIQCQGYRNGSWEDIGTPITGISNDTNYHSAILNTSNNYTKFRWYVTQRWESNVEMYGTSVADLRIYGRKDV